MLNGTNIQFLSKICLLKYLSCEIISSNGLGQV